jgi:caffeoyl-CoA O-methyltransferase
VNDISALAGLLVRAAHASRVLEIGTGVATSSSAIAAALPPDGMLITVERDAAAAYAARRVLIAHGHKVSVMIGEASRFLHKISGPFDLILQNGDAGQFDQLHDRVIALLRASGTLVTHGLNHAGDYNERILRDPRLETLVLNIGEGLAISVKRQDYQ